MFQYLHNPEHQFQKVYLGLHYFIILIAFQCSSLSTLTMQFPWFPIFLQFILFSWDIFCESLGALMIIPDRGTSVIQ